MTTMKCTISFLLVFFLEATAIAQPPQSFKYQAVARDASGNPLANKPVSLMISILKGSASGIVVYSESHLRTTNAFGLFDLEVGKGNILSGSFSGIGWATGDFFIRVEIDRDGGSTFQLMGITQLLSVPYALFAQDVLNKDDADADPTNELQKISISGTVLSLDKNGGSVVLPSSGGGDNWGTQSATTDATLAGTGTSSSPLKIAQQGATANQVLKWNGTT
jgi:hypothetical protein